MKLKILFYLALILTLFSCKREVQPTGSNVLPKLEFKSTIASELYYKCEKFKLLNNHKLKAAAEQLANLPNDPEAKKIGTFYKLLSNHFTNGNVQTIKELELFYDQLEGPKYEKFRAFIDIIAIGRYYYTYDYPGITNRLEHITTYIYKPEHWLERTAFKFYMAYQDQNGDFGKIIEEYTLIAPVLKEYEWNYYHNILYGAIANLYKTEGNDEKAKEIFNYIITENSKAGLTALNIGMYCSLNHINNDVKLLEKAEKFSKKSGHMIHMSLIYRSLGHVYFDSENYKKALIEYSRAVEIDSLTNEMSGYAFDNIYKGWTFFKLNPTKEGYLKSLTYYENAISKKEFVSQPKHYLQEIIKRKIYALEFLNETQDLLEAKASYFDLENTPVKGGAFTNPQLKSLIANFKLSSATKDNEVNILKTKEAVNQQKIASQRLVMALGAIVLLLLLCLLIFNFNRLKKADEIKEKNAIIKSQNTELQKSVKKLSDNSQVLNTINLQLEEVLKRRDKVIKRLKQFAFTLAHDLSDPLLAIKTFGFLLNKTTQGKLDTKEGEFLETILEASSRLSEKVNLLYKYSTNTLVLFDDFKIIEVNKIIKEIKQDLSLSITEKKAIITCEEIPFINGNEVLIYQLFQNLISNSLKYCKPNTKPEIQISSYVEANELIICIKDNGIGIQEHSNKDIFELFERAENSKNTKGKGIGLAIAKEAVEIHSGRIWFQSDPKVGTTFFISFKEFGKQIKNNPIF